MAHVLIIGGGSAGLLLAQGFKKDGITCTVFEKAPASTYTTRPRDWTMALHWGNDALKTVLPAHLNEKIRCIQPDPDVQFKDDQETSLILLNAQTGELLNKIPVPTIRRATRSKLNNFLREEIDVVPGKELVDIVLRDDGRDVTAKFADGTSATGTVLIGADGSASKVRRWLLGEKAALRVFPQKAYNFISTYDAKTAVHLRDCVHPTFTGAIHPKLNAFLLLAPVDMSATTDPSTWRFQTSAYQWTGTLPITTPDDVLDHPPPTSAELSSADPAERLRHWKSIWGSSCEPFRSAAEAISDSTVIPQDRVSHWARPSLWDNRQGRVTLAGDAAHAMSPHRAQGLNNSLQDAAEYVECVLPVLLAAGGGRVDVGRLKEATDRYDAGGFERGKREIAISALQSYKLTHVEEMASSHMAKHGLAKSS